jgi:two-component system sensor histidine kinase VicK
MLDPAEFFLDQAQASPHVYFIYDLTTQRVVFVNAAYERMLGGRQAQVNDELPGLLARLHPDDLPVLRLCWRLWQKGGLHDEVEVRLVAPDQPDEWFCLTPHWYQDAAGQAWVGGLLRNTSVSKEHRENMHKFNTKKNTVLEILAHDLAGAFVMLQQLTEYVQEEMSPQLNPRVPEMLRLMQSTSQQSVQMIRNLVDQEFMESSKVSLRRERVDLREKVRQCLEPFERAPGRGGQQLTCELPDEPVYVEVDISKLLQVVTNLISNALKYTHDDGRITVKVEAGPDRARIIVTDEGIGIPEALLPGLFERFTKARRPGLRGEPTTGLGLSLCKTIVRLHQGTLTVASTEGQGSTFTVELPLSAAPG